MSKKIIALILAIVSVAALVFFLRNTHSLRNSTTAPHTDAAAAGVASHSGVVRVTESGTTGKGATVRTNLEVDKKAQRIKSTMPKTPKSASTKVSARSKVGGPNDVDQIRKNMELSHMFRKLWSPFSYAGKLDDQGIELLEIKDAETAALKDALIKLQNKYAEHMATQSKLLSESNTSATFKIEPYGDMAQMTNQEFLDGIKNKVSDETYNLMSDGLLEFTRWFGYGLPWSSEYQDYKNYYHELTITKMPDGDTFEIRLITRDADGTRIGQYSSRGMGKQGVINFCGQMINSHNSSILK